MMENRSFDHIMGWLPGADGKQAGLSYLDPTGAAHATYPLAPDFQGCAHADPDHSYDGARVEWNNGACDGWLRESGGDLYPIGYYRQQDLPFLGRAAPAFTACDRYFASILGPTFPNRLYLHSGVTDRLDDAFDRVDLPTIWDRLAAAKIPARYYCGNVSFLLLWNGKYDSITHTHQQFFADCKTGKLPAYSMVDPDLTLDDTGPQSGIMERRPSARRHPRGRVLPLDGLQRRHPQPGVVAHAARGHLRRMGRVLRPRAAARGA